MNRNNSSALVIILFRSNVIDLKFFDRNKRLLIKEGQVLTQAE